MGRRKPDIKKLRWRRNRDQRAPESPAVIENPWKPQESEPEWTPRNRAERRLVFQARKQAGRQLMKMRGKRSHLYRQARWKTRLLRDLERT